MTVLLKEAGPEDAELISKLAIETFCETYAWYNTPENMRLYTEKHFNKVQTEKEILETKTKFFLLFENDEPAGYAKLRVFVPKESLWEEPPELTGGKHIEIERIYVLKKHQKKKLGLELIKKCIEYSMQNKYEIIWLGVWEKNSKAIDFYAKVGFVKFGTHDFQFGNDLQKDHLMKFDL